MSTLVIGFIRDPNFLCLVPCFLVQVVHMKSKSSNGFFSLLLTPEKDEF